MVVVLLFLKSGFAVADSFVVVVLDLGLKFLERRTCSLAGARVGGWGRDPAAAASVGSTDAGQAEELNALEGPRSTCICQ